METKLSQYTYQQLTGYLIGFAFISLLMVLFIVWLVNELRVKVKRLKELEKLLQADINIAVESNKTTTTYSRRLTSKKIANKLKDIGCNSNCLGEIFEFFRKYYNIHIYIYGYYSKTKTIGIESKDSISFVVHVEEDGYIANQHAIDLVLIKIKEYNLQPNK